MQWERSVTTTKCIQTNTAASTGCWIGPRQFHLGGLALITVPAAIVTNFALERGLRSGSVIKVRAITRVLVPQYPQGR